MKTLYETWIDDENKAFEGWNFSYLEDRWKNDEISWNYRDIIENYIDNNKKLLDMGTGGGEFLLSLNHPYDNTTVTEAWEPNIQLCKERLSPLGVNVVPIIDDSNIPLPDNSFDIIINRHEAYDLSEVFRLLKPNGVFITQQVGTQDCLSLAKSINSNYTSMYKDFTLDNELKLFVENGFNITYSNEEFPLLSFYDVGAIVYFAKIIQWTFPDFSVDKNIVQLKELQKTLEENGVISTKQHRFIIVANKKG